MFQNKFLICEAHIKGFKNQFLFSFFSLSAYQGFYRVEIFMQLTNCGLDLGRGPSAESNTPMRILQECQI